MNTIKNVRNNELIKKRRKKKRIKKTIVFFVFLICVLVILAFKLPYFNIKYVDVINNKNVTLDFINENITIKKGDNIFYINTKYAKESLLLNPYIDSVIIKRKLPNKIVIEINERDAVYYYKEDEKYYILNSEGILIEKRLSIKEMNLTHLKGLDFTKAEIGKKIPSDDERKYSLLKELHNIINSNTSEYKISEIDVSNMVDLKIYFDNMCVKLGTSEGLEDKINKAINIIDSNNLKKSKGYIDVSYDGMPVYYIEPELEKNK